jgi:hypothetical protein
LFRAAETSATAKTGMARIITQLDLDLAEGWHRAEVGAARAADHAERKREDWNKRAMQFLEQFIDELKAETFLCEDLRIYAYEKNFEAPPDERAWGQIIMKAARRRLIENVGLAHARDKKVHANITTCWKRVSN